MIQERRAGPWSAWIEAEALSTIPMDRLDPTHWWSGRSLLFLPSVRAARDCLAAWQRQAVQRVPPAIAYHLVIRRNSYIGLGRFDLGVMLSRQNGDYCMRIAGFNGRSALFTQQDYQEEHDAISRRHQRIDTS